MLLFAHNTVTSGTYVANAELVVCPATCMDLGPMGHLTNGKQAVLSLVHSK